jgi:serine/threonine protein kinase
VHKIKIGEKIQALKEVYIFKDKVSRDLQITRLKNEMELNYKIKFHKNILEYDKIIWFSKENKILGIVMSYIEGESLEKVINSRDLNWIEIYEIIIKICFGIQFLHNEKSNFYFKNIKKFAIEI